MLRKKLDVFVCELRVGGSSETSTGLLSLYNNTGVGMFCVMNVTSLLWYQCLYQYAYVSDETSTEERESHENIYCLFNLYFIE